MGEFRAIRHVADVHIGQILAERMARELGTGWDSLSLKGDAWAYCEGARALGIGGIEPVWRGRCVLWSYAADLSLGDWRRVLRFTRLRIGRAMASEDVRRVEACASLSSDRYCRFLERLGLEAEGVMRAWSPLGEDMMMFARVKS